MNTNHLFAIALFSIFIFSCTPPKMELGLAEKYFPDAFHLKEGIVNKYYAHYKSKDGYDTSTGIEYWEYRSNSPNSITVNRYSPAFEMIRSDIYGFSENKMITKEKKFFFRKDTFINEISHPVFIDWNNNPPPSKHQSKFTYKNNFERTTATERTFVKDTTVLNRPAKIYSSEVTDTTTLENGEISERQESYDNVYVEGIGLFSSKGELDKGFLEMELIEQIPMGRFNKLKQHDIKRTGYIDPEKRIDKENDFSTCGPIELIVDYYNSQPDAGYPGRKKALWEIMNAQIDKNKLHNESGYLTFRFVINCNGETGRFITEESNLDFIKKEFNQETVDHLYKIVKELKGWEAPFLRGELRDTYIYLTFKLKDGEIIELLP